MVGCWQGETHRAEVQQPSLSRTLPVKRAANIKAGMRYAYPPPRLEAEMHSRSPSLLYLGWLNQCPRQMEREDLHTSLETTEETSPTPVKALHVAGMSVERNSG